MHVFLDIDGVLATEDTWDAWYAGGADPARRHELLDPDCVRFVQQLCDRLAARVVVSSSWRRGSTLEQLAELFARVGLVLDLVDATPIRDDFDRGREIADWLEANGVEAADVIILEDAEEVEPFEHRTVRPWFCGDGAGFRGPQLADALRLAGIDP